MAIVSLAAYSFEKKKAEIDDRAEIIHHKLEELKALMHQDIRFRELSYTLETVDNYVVRHLT